MLPREYLSKAWTWTESAKEGMSGREEESNDKADGLKAQGLNTSSFPVSLPLEKFKVSTLVWEIL